MSRLSSRALGAALAVSCGAVHAGTIDARFTGTVDVQQNTTFAVGAAITGEFVYDTTLARYTAFTIGGQTVSPGYSSTASITPDLYSAIYEAQVSPVPGGTTNSTFVLDLESLLGWPSNNAIALLLNTTQLATNLDTTLSNFGFYNADANGTNVRSLDATLASINVTAVPEPGFAALLVVGASAMWLRRRPRAAH